MHLVGHVSTELLNDLVLVKVVRHNKLEVLTEVCSLLLAAVQLIIQTQYHLLEILILPRQHLLQAQARNCSTRLLNLNVENTVLRKETEHQTQ